MAVHDSSHRSAPLRWLRATSSSSRACCTLGYLLLPNVVVMVFSFNKPERPLQLRSGSTFSTDAWTRPVRRRRHVRLARRSASRSPLWATHRRHRPRHDDRLRAGPLPLPGARRRQLADLPADGDARGRHGRLAGARSSSTWASQFGFWTILIAHIMFCLSFVVTAVKARVMSMDPRLEQAAQDLYAGPVQTFLRVTLPIAAPGIAAGALLVLRALLRRLHHHQFQRGLHRHLPHVRLGIGAARHARSDQCHRHGHVRHRRAVSCSSASWPADRRKRSKSA